MTTTRRTFLRAGAAGLVFSTAAGFSPSYAATTTRKRAYVVVIDGCRPDELDSGLTPTLAGLRDAGLRFPRAQSMPVMETIPNHVMMMTGVRPDRSGVPANSIYDREMAAVRDMDQPTDITVTTLIERLNRHGLTTGTVLSKEYLYGVFGERATHRWEPQPTLPITEHAPDVFTIEAAITMHQELDPHLMFVNLGDIDRFGHADLTGTTLRLARRAALADTDAQVGRFVDALQESGAWDHAVMIVLADHSMDWSTPGKVISLSGPLAEDDLLADRVQIADNGGADLLYWTGPDNQREQAVRRMRAITTEQEGVLAAYDRTAPWLRLGPEAGDVVVFCEAGWRFSDPDPVTSNPIPGNHGHPATRSIPFFVAGGHRAVPRRTASTRMAHTVDVTPTLARFFGVGAPKGGYDGRALL
ncbi:alkaline phosphatase family protein [Nocardioides mangrovi]|uniref:Alkaline phosphatase family protein n=1 Tax=Nocardioides mangrovi TaxID=2874580 RepID=A0ABS7UA00_9ACTN|nr:alkaline phosphatase family protein [Nocardioides mangrovi]MBZ5737700.1 alkaline phosphatase family protein [Nocardioides mangrovi]